MICKTLEIRDRGTFIPVLLVRLEPTDARDRWLLKRAGFGDSAEHQGKFVLLINLVKGCPYDPFGHGPARTLKVAHLYVLDHFDRLENGAVLDVEYILGERFTPKQTEQR